MKKKVICFVMAISMISVMLTGCGSEKKSSKEDSKKIAKEKNDKKESKKDKSKKEKKQKEMEEMYDAVIEEAAPEEAAPTAEEAVPEVTEEAEAPEETVSKVEGTTKKVVIDGKDYLEVTLSVIDGNDIYYKFEDYAVTVASPWEEVGTDLNGEKDGDEADFMVCIQQPKKIRTQKVVINYPELEEAAYQLGYTEFEMGEMSDVYRSGDPGTISFGRAYYDYDSTLYVDVFITVPKKMYSATIAIPLK